MAGFVEKKAPSIYSKVFKLKPEEWRIIDDSLFFYKEYQSGNTKDRDSLIQALGDSLIMAKESLGNAVLISHCIARLNHIDSESNTKNAKKEGIEEGVKIQKRKHGSNTSPFKAHEQVILILFDEYQASLSSFNKQTLITVKAKIETQTSLKVGDKNFERWRSNYKRTLGKTIFSQENT
jgi:hypothetical protein